MAPIMHCGHSSIQRLGGCQPGTVIHVFGRHIRAVACHRRKISMRLLVAREAAEQRVPHVPVVSPASLCPARRSACAHVSRILRIGARTAGTEPLEWHWRMLDGKKCYFRADKLLPRGRPATSRRVATIASETPDNLEVRGTTNYTLDRKAPFLATPAFLASK